MPVFRRTLAPGVYRLRDFVLYSGANRIRIVVTPLDGSEVTETEMDVMYSSSLLAPGEAYFNVSLATGHDTFSATFIYTICCINRKLFSGRLH